MDIDSAMRAAKDLKERIVRARGIGADVAPMLDLRRDGEPVAILSLFDAAESAETLWLAIEEAIALLAPDEAIQIGEAFVHIGITNREINTYEHGTLQRRFAAHDPAVAECLLFAGSTRTGDWTGATVPYTYQGRTVVWGETSHQIGLPEGNGPDAFQRGFLRADKPIDLVTAAPRLARVGITVMGLRAERNSPCPCGSGRKFKHCHLHCSP